MMVAAATLARSVPPGKQPGTDRRSVAERRGEVSGMEKKGDFKALSGLLSVVLGRRGVSEALSETPRTPRSFRCDAGAAACSRGGRSRARAEGFMWLSRGPPAPASLPGGWPSFYETAGEELGASLVPDHRFRSHFLFSSLGGTRPGARHGLVQTQKQREAHGPEEAARQVCRGRQPRAGAEPLRPGVPRHGLLLPDPTGTRAPRAGDRQPQGKRQLTHKCGAFRNRNPGTACAPWNPGPPPPS